VWVIEASEQRLYLFCCCGHCVRCRGVGVSASGEVYQAASLSMSVSYARVSGLCIAKRVVFDIDGVLLRGGQLIPGAAVAVRKLAAARIPFVFVTNGGGMLEAAKAADLTKKLGLQVCIPIMLYALPPTSNLQPPTSNLQPPPTSPSTSTSYPHILISLYPHILQVWPEQVALCHSPMQALARFKTHLSIPYFTY
jgi:hypothetical protein